MHEVALRPSERPSLKVDLFRLTEVESYYKLKKLYHTPSYWSIVMTSPVEFSTGKFRAKQVGKSFKMA